MALGDARAGLFFCFVRDTSVSGPRRQPVLNETRLAEERYGAHAPWFRANIPFLEIDDADFAFPPWTRNRCASF